MGCRGNQVMIRENTQVRTFGGVEMAKIEAIRWNGGEGDWNQLSPRHCRVRCWTGHGYNIGVTQDMGTES